MKITLAKPFALNGEILPAGTHDLPDASAKKLIEKKVAVEAAEGAEPAAPRSTRKSREDKAAE